MSLVFQDDGFTSVLQRFQMHRLVELHIEVFVEEFVYTTVLLVLAVLLCLDMCNISITETTKGNFTFYE